MSCRLPRFPGGGQGKLKSREVDQGTQFPHQGFRCKPLDGLFLFPFAIFSQEGQLLVRRVKVEVCIPRDLNPTSPSMDLNGALPDR